MRPLLKFAQSMEAKWKLHAPDEYTSDVMEWAPADDGKRQAQSKMTTMEAMKMRHEARVAYADLREEGQSEMDAEFAAYENTYDLYEDEGFQGQDIANELQGFLTRR